MNSLDILYLIIAFAVLWVASFICWFIWQVVVLLKEVHKTVHSLTAAIDDVKSAIDGVKSKFGPGKLHDHIKSTFASMKSKK